MLEDLGVVDMTNYTKLKKQLLSIPWWSFPFIGFGIFDMSNNGPNITNSLILFVPLSLAVIFWIHGKMYRQKVSLKRERKY